MKKYNLIFDPNDKIDGILFNNIKIEKLVGTTTIERQAPIVPDEQIFSKNKSEVVEYESEEYAALKEEEQYPYIISDSNANMFSGKLQRINNSGSVYFVMVNTGNQLRIVPISKRYAFVHKGIVEDDNVDVLEKRLGATEVLGEDDDERDENTESGDSLGEDDDDDARVVYKEREKQLSGSGRVMKKLVDTLENEEIEENAVDEKGGEEGKKMRMAVPLSKEALKKYFENKKMSIKDLLRQVKVDYELNEDEKKLIREFMCESCTFETNKKTGEKLFKLK